MKWLYMHKFNIASRDWGIPWIQTVSGSVWGSKAHLPSTSNKHCPLGPAVRCQYSFLFRECQMRSGLRTTGWERPTDALSLSGLSRELCPTRHCSAAIYKSDVHQTARVYEMCGDVTCLTLWSKVFLGKLLRYVCLCVFCACPWTSWPTFMKLRMNKRRYWLWAVNLLAPDFFFNIITFCI